MMMIQIPFTSHCNFVERPCLFSVFMRRQSTFPVKGKLFKKIIGHIKRARWPGNHRLESAIRCSKFDPLSSENEGIQDDDDDDGDYLNSTVIEAVEVRNGSDDLMVKMRDGRYLKCVYNQSRGPFMPDYLSHPAIVLQIENGSGLILPIIVLEMPSILVMAALRNIEMAPIKVNKHLVYSDGLMIVETTSTSLRTSRPTSSLSLQMDRPDGQPCPETEEFVLVQNMLLAAFEERYSDAAQWKDMLNHLRSKRRDSL